MEEIIMRKKQEKKFKTSKRERQNGNSGLEKPRKGLMKEKEVVSNEQNRNKEGKGHFVGMGSNY